MADYEEYAAILTADRSLCPPKLVLVVNVNIDTYYPPRDNPQVVLVLLGSSYVLS